MIKSHLSSSYLLTPLIQISSGAFALLMLLQMAYQYFTLEKKQLEIKWYDYLNCYYLSPSATPEYIFTFYIAITPFLVVHTVLNVVFIVSLFQKIVTPQISAFLYIYVLVSQMLAIAPVVNALVPFLVIIRGSCSMYNSYCLNNGHNIALYVFFFLVIAVHMLALVFFAIVTTPDDFQHSRVVLLSGFLFFILLAFYIVTQIIALGIRELYQKSIFIVLKVLQALITGLFPFTSNKYLVAMYCVCYMYFALYSLRLYISFPILAVVFACVIQRVNLVIEKALVWLIAQRRHVHQKAADQQFDIDFCFNPNLFFVMLHFFEQIAMFLTENLSTFVQSFLPFEMAMDFDTFFHKYFHQYVVVPEEYQNVYAIQFITHELNGISAFLLQKYYFYYIQHRFKASDNINAKIVLFSTLDYCLIQQFLVDQYEMYYACYYFEGKQIYSIFREQKIQLPYAKAIAYIAESKFGHNMNIKLNYIIALRYQLNSIAEAYEQINIYFEMEGDKGKEDKRQKFQEYQALYYRIIQRVLGEDFHLEKVMEEVRKEQKISFKINKLQQRMSIYKNVYKECVIIARLLEQWNGLDTAFIYFWQYSESCDVNQLLLHIYQLKRYYRHFLLNIRTAKRMSSGLFLFDVFMCAANRYFQLEKLNLKLYHQYQSFRVRFQEGQANIIIDSDYNYKIINHYHPSFFYLKRRYGMEPQIIITQQNNQVQERTFEQNINPISVGQIQKGNQSVTTTYGPDEKCKLDSLSYHFYNDIRRFKIFDLKRIFSIGIVVAILFVLLVCFSEVVFPGTFDFLNARYEEIKRVSQQLTLYSSFIKTANILCDPVTSLKDVFAKVIAQFEELGRKIGQNLNHLEYDVRPFILFLRDYRRESTQQMSYFILKTAMLTDRITKYYLTGDTSVFREFKEYSFPMAVAQQYPMSERLLEFDYILAFLMLILAIPFVVTLINNVIQSYVVRDYSIMAYLFHLLTPKLKMATSKHYTSFAQIRKRYNEIYGNNNVSYYLDVVIGGNYFDSEVITDLTFQQLLKTYYNTQIDEDNMGLIVSQASELFIAEQSLPMQRKSLFRAFFCSLHFKCVLDIILISILILLAGIATVEFQHHQQIRSEESQKFHHLKEQFFRFSYESLAMSYLRYMHLFPDQQVEIADKMYDFDYNNSIRSTVLDIVDAIYDLGAINYQAARALSDLIAFVSALRHLEMITFNFMIIGINSTLDYNFTNYKLKDLLATADNCEFVDLRTNAEDKARLTEEDVGNIVKELLFGCFTERLNAYVFNLIEYINKELEYQQQYHYLDKLENMLFTKPLVNNYYSHYLGYNQQESLYIWPYTNINHPAYTTSHRSDFYQKTDEMVAYLRSLLSENASNEFIDYLAQGPPRAEVLSWDITTHFYLLIFAFDGVIAVFILMYLLQYRKWVDVLFMALAMVPILFCQILVLRFKQSEYIMVYETTYLNSVNQQIAEDYAKFALYAYRFATLAPQASEQYFREIHVPLIDMVATTVKYHSLMNIGRNERFPKVPVSYLTVDEYRMERLLFVALREIIPSTLNGSLQTDRPIDINSLNANSILRPLLLFADHVQNFCGMMDKVIAFIITSYKRLYPDLYRENFAELEDCTQFYFIRYILDFNQTKIDDLFLNKESVDDYSPGTILPSLAWFDGHVQWTGYNYFENDQQRLLEDCRKQVSLIAFSYEYSLQLSDIFSDVNQMNMLTKWYCFTDNDNKAITITISSPILFYLMLLAAGIFSVILSIRTKRYVEDAVILYAHIGVYCVEKRVIYKFFKPSYLLGVIPIALGVFMVVVLLLIFLQLVLLHRVNYLVFTYWSVANMQSRLEKLEGLEASYYFSWAEDHSFYSMYSSNRLISQMQDEMNHILTYEDIPRENTVVYIYNDLQLLRESTRKMYSHQSSFSAGSFYSIPTLIKRAFLNEYISVPLIDIYPDIYIINRAYLNKILNISEPPYILMKYQQIFDSFLTQGDNFTEYQLSERLQLITQMRGALTKMWSDIDMEIIEEGKSFSKLQIGLTVSCVVFAVALVICWSTVICLCTEGKFLRYLLRKLRTEDFSILPAVYSDAADV